MSRRHNLSSKDKTRRREAVIQRDGWACWICEAPIDPHLPPQHPEAKTLDHVIPRGRGGSNKIENLRLAHLCCNNTRGAPKIKMTSRR